MKVKKDYGKIIAKALIHNTNGKLEIYNKRA